MKKVLFLSLCLLGLLACGGQQKKSAAVQEQNKTQQEITQEIPHIFHGMTKTLSVANILDDGEFAGFSEHKSYEVKYALYLDKGFIAIFDDNEQQHLFIEYLGCEETDGNSCYLFSTFDRSVRHGFVEFNYTNDGRVLLLIDYPEYAMGYFLETYMPEEEFAKRLKERYNR